MRIFAISSFIALALVSFVVDARNNNLCGNPHATVQLEARTGPVRSGASQTFDEKKKAFLNNFTVNKMKVNASVKPQMEAHAKQDGDNDRLDRLVKADAARSKPKSKRY